jgi:hypothetical protein
MTGQITLRPWSAQPQHAGIWRVGIDHPGKLNAMSRAMWVALRETLQAVNARSDVRCLVVQGEGGFCAGGDIAEYPGFRFDEAQLTHFHESEVWGGLQALLDCPVPVVAAIRGACMGAGVEISSCCDLRVATEDAKFGAPIARLGFPMAPRELGWWGGKWAAWWRAACCWKRPCFLPPRWRSTVFWDRWWLRSSWTPWCRPRPRRWRPCRHWLRA